jgi:hypothetical protein
MAAIPFSTLRQRVGRLMGAMYLATPSANFSTTVTDTDELVIFPNTFFDDWHGRFYKGSNRDTDFEVTASLKAAGKLTISPAAPFTIDAQDLIELHQDFTPAEINDAINLSISMVDEEALIDIVDESIQVRSTVFEYVLPLSIYSIDRIYQEQSTEDRYSPSANIIDQRHWRILHGSTPRLWFNDSYVSLTADRNLRIVGQKSQPQLDLDDDLCSINQAFIVYQAKALLHESKIRGEGSEFEGHSTQMRLAQAMAAMERERISVPLRGLRV